MNRKEAKELMPIIQAFAEGKTIQYYDTLIDIDDWEDCENPDFENLTYKFRIKPETTYRPFANAEECWQEMQKHQPFGWVKDNETQSFFVCKAFGNILFSIGIEDKPYNYNEVLRYYTFADGTPFGIKVEE